MKTTILTISVLLLMGCASMGTQQKWILPVIDEDGKIEEKGKWENEKRYICKGVGCKVDFKNETMEGGTYLPSMPVRVN